MTARAVELDLQAVARLEADDKRDLLARLKTLRDSHSRAQWEPYPWQRPHEHPGRVCDASCAELPTTLPVPQGVWLQFGGRGTGKTDGAARYVAEHVRGPACDPRLPGGHRLAIIAPTLGDAAESCVNGPSGLSVHCPGVRLWSSAGGTFVRFPNGALAKLFGASTPDDVERLRAGGNRCLAWWEELAAWRRLEECMDHSRLGLRLGSRAHVVASTTPKTRPQIVKLVKESDVIVTRGRTRDAVHLDEATRAAYEARYSGTRRGRQELDGELLTDIEGALWTYTQLDAGRARGYELQSLIDVMAKIAVAIDPAVTNNEESDETGIVVAGSTSREECPMCGPIKDGPHAFILGDYSGHYGASEWADLALTLYDRFEADEIVAEVNNGGDLVRETISAAVRRAQHASVPYRDVRASRGKVVRAEPVAVLYGNVDPANGPLRSSRVHHVEAADVELTQLEDQQTTWTQDDDSSPDRMDALVWVLTRLLLKRSGGSATAA